MDQLPKIEKVLVFGGRDFKDKAMLYGVLDGFWKTWRFKFLIEGGARGADDFAGEWATDRGIQLVICPANWNRNGKAAGPIRNEAMKNLQPDVGIEFPGGVGTADMKKRLQDAGIQVLEAVLLPKKNQWFDENATEIEIDD